MRVCVTVCVCDGVCVAVCDGVCVAVFDEVCVPVTSYHIAGRPNIWPTLCLNAFIPPLSAVFLKKYLPTKCFLI